MFAGLRRFQKGIWLVAAIVIIPPFVIFFSPQAGSAFRDRGAGEFGVLDGNKITQQQFLEARHEALFRMRMYTGRWPESETERLNDFTYYQLLINQQVKEQGIHVSEDAVTRTAQSFGVTDLDAFMKQVPFRGASAPTKDDFIRFCEHEAAYRELTHLAAAAGQLVIPRESEERFRKQYSEFAAQAVFFNTSDYTNGVAVTEDSIGRYYTNYQSNYRLQERIQVAYVEFPKEKFLSDADRTLASRTNLDAVIDQEYQRRGTTNFTDLNNPSVILGEKEAKQQLRDTIRKQTALMAGYNKATEFADKMMTANQTTAAGLESFAASSAEKPSVKVSSPFERGQVPPELKGVAPEVSGRLFDLTNSAASVLFVPIMGEDAVYLAAVKQRLPSQVEPLPVVRSRVVADYVKSQARDLASRAGNAFYASLTNQMPSGKSFAEVAASSRLRVETLPPFSLATESLPELSGRMDINYLKNSVSRMTNGAVSRFLFTQEGGAVIHLKERHPASEAIHKEKYPAFLQEEKLARMNDTLNKWFSKVDQAKLQRPATSSKEGAAK